MQCIIIVWRVTNFREAGLFAPPLVSIPEKIQGVFDYGLTLLGLHVLYGENTYWTLICVYYPCVNFVISTFWIQMRQSIQGWIN